MPRKIRQLIKDLERVGFINRGGKGSHRNYLHPKGVVLTISGKLGDDVNLIQTCASCTFNNITSVISPNFILSTTFFG